MKNYRSWTEYADEHILLLRGAAPAIEYVKVVKDPDNENLVRYIHSEIFVGEYDLENPDVAAWIDHRLQQVGFNGLDDMVEQMSPHAVNLMKREDGSPIRYDNPTYVVDYRFLASLLIETSDDLGVPLSREAALDLVNGLTDMKYNEITC